MTSPESRFHYVLYPTDHQICSCEDCVRAADCRRGFEGSKQCSVRRGDSKGCCSEAWDSSKIINQVQLGKYFLWEPLWVTCFSEPSLSRVGFSSDFVVGLVWFSLVVKWNVMYFISYLLPFVLPLHTAQKGLVQLPSPPPTFLTRYLGTFLRSLLTYLFWRLNKAQDSPTSCVHSRCFNPSIIFLAVCCTWSSMAVFLLLLLLQFLFFSPLVSPIFF